jgi:glycosyltransferase involved in cell wall biosynthesis
MKKKKILFLDTPIEPPGGGQMSLVYLLKNLDKNKYEFSVFVPYYCSFIEILKKEGINVEIVPFKKLFFKIKNFKPDLIHSNSPTTRCSFYGVLFSKILEIPFIWHSRVLETAGWKERLIAKLSSKIIVISDVVGRKFSKFYYKTIKIYNAVDFEGIKITKNKEELKNELGIKNEYVVGIFSRLVKWKGHNLFLETAKKIIENGIKSKFLILGDGEEKENIINKIRELGLSNYFLVLGHRENVYNFINICDIVCNFSIEPEPFGRTIIEAMALKKVVFSTNIGGPNEIIDDGIDGFLCEANSDIISKKIIEVFKNPELMNKIEENAYKKVFNNFNIKTQIEKIESLYEEVIRKK